MSATSKIAALKRLAERPGTEAEGRVAREKLKLLQQKERANPTPKRQALQEWLDSINGPRSVKCACGESFMSNTRCAASLRHKAIRAEVVGRFQKGDVVFYNKWAYEVNSKGVIVGHVKETPDNWAWLRIKFAHLKTARAVPVYSSHGWHLSKTPLNFTDIGNLRYPDEQRGAQWSPKLT